MATKTKTLFGAVIGLVVGIAGAAFSMGANRQHVNGTLATHTTQIAAAKESDKLHEESTQKELDRLASIIASQISLIQTGINQLTNTVGDLRTDVSVLKAIMEHVKQDLEKKSH